MTQPELTFVTWYRSQNERFIKYELESCFRRQKYFNGGLVRRVCGVWCADNYWTKSDLTLPIDVCRISKMVLPWMTSPETINTDTSTDSAQPESSGRAREYPCEFRACYQVISWSLVCCVQSLSLSDFPPPGLPSAWRYYDTKRLNMGRYEILATCTFQLYRYWWFHI